MTFDALGEICFGYFFNSQKTKLNPFGKAIADQCRGVVDFRARTLLEFLPFMWYMPFGPANILKESTRICNQVMDEVIGNSYELILTMYWRNNVFQNDQLVCVMSRVIATAKYHSTESELMYFVRFKYWWRVGDHTFNTCTKL